MEGYEGDGHQDEYIRIKIKLKMEQKEIDKKLEEREQLVQQMQQLQQQQAQIQNEIGNISARVLVLNGWIECAFNELGIKSMDEYLQQKHRRDKEDGEKKKLGK